MNQLEYTHKFNIGDIVWFPVWDMKNMKFILCKFEIIRIQIEIDKNYVLERYKIHSKKHNITMWKNVNELFETEEKCNQVYCKK